MTQGPDGGEPTGGTEDTADDDAGDDGAADDSVDDLLRRVAAAPDVPLVPVRRGPAALPSRIAARYVPVRFIAEGGMGRVYEVEDTLTGERLALKLLMPAVAASPGMIDRFKREARASARLRSEHVARVRDADLAPELDGAPFLVMELLLGMDLEQAAASGPLPPSTVVAWLSQAAEAVDEAHAAGIVHRDLKPANLFLAQRVGGPPIVKVLDFGIAKVVEDAGAPTAAGQMLGTPRYMAPEQVAREVLTPACDHFALGLIAYRLLAGQSYHRGDVMQTLSELLRGPLEPPSLRCSLFGLAFDTWFARACHRDPGLRFETAVQQIAALDAVLARPH